MKILFTICARAGSKGVKSKNVRDFLQIPIAYYTLAAYQGFVEKYQDQYDEIALAVNTDSEILKEQCDKSKIKYIYIPRMQELGGDFVAKSDVICNTLENVEKDTKKKFDIVIDLDLTSPLRMIDDIYNGIERVKEYPDANVAYSVTNSRRQPHFNLVLEDEKGYLHIAIPSEYVARQEAPKSYDMNASIYVYRRDALLQSKEKDIFAGKCVGWLMKDTAVLDIDSEEDYELMQILAKYFFEKNSDMAEVYDRAKTISKEAF